MKRIILGFIILIISIVSCQNSNKSYELLERAMISILEYKNPKYIERELNKVLRTGNADAYYLAYLYLGNSKKDFFDKYLGKSKGNAEYYKAIMMINDGNIENNVVIMLENAAKEGNKKAYYMLGNIFQDKLEFSKAQEYFKRGKEKGDIYSEYLYNFNNNLKKYYLKIEELNKKLIENNISKDEKKELGTLILEKFSNYEKSYAILKEFLDENYNPALYSKAKILENENKKQEAKQIYNELYFNDFYYLAAFEIAYDLANNHHNYKLASEVLDKISSDDSLINGYKGYVYAKLKDYKKSEKYYLKAVKKNDIDMMGYLGQFYEDKKDLKKSKEIYKKAYSLGSIDSGYKLSKLIEFSGKDSIKIYRINKEAKKILERLSENGDDNSIVDLSLYYKPNSYMFKILNLRAGVKLNSTALYNLGVYYYNKKSMKKAKIYFKAAKEYGYKLDYEFQKILESK